MSEKQTKNRNATRPGVSGTKLVEIEDAPHLQVVADKLWSLLDDIDTASDMFKPTDLEGYQAFYKYTMRRVAERFKHLEGDGYDLFLPTEG
jgi:hypothetical protein